MYLKWNHLIFYNMSSFPTAYMLDLTLYKKIDTCMCDNSTCTCTRERKETELTGLGRIQLACSFCTITLAACRCLLPSSESSGTAEVLLQATSLTHNWTFFHLCSAQTPLQVEADSVCINFTLS